MATLETISSPGLHLLFGNARKRRAADRGIVHTKSQDGLFTWTYTTHLFLSFDHPEILVAGLDPFLADSIITHLMELIQHGAVYENGSTTETALHQHTCVFRNMSPAAASALMPALGSRPALQLVYPDQKNRLPWEPAHNSSWRAAQPLFLAGESLGETESRFLVAAAHRPLLEDRRHLGQPAPFLKFVPGDTHGSGNQR